MTIVTVVKHSFNGFIQGLIATSMPHVALAAYSYIQDESS